MFYNQARLSFLRRMLQIHRNFLTTCTQKSIQEAKSQAYVTFSGRSMVEMLGGTCYYWRFISWCYFRILQGYDEI